MKAQEVNTSKKVTVEFFYSLWYEDAFKAFLDFAKTETDWHNGFTYTTSKSENGKGTYYQITIEPFDIWCLSQKWILYKTVHNL